MRLKPDLVNPLFEHGHREARTVALGDCLHFVAQQRPTVVDRATGGAQSVLRPMSQGMDYLALIDNADFAEEPVEPFRRTGRAAFKQRLIYHLGQIGQYGGGEWNAAMRLRCLFADDDVAAAALFLLVLNLERLTQSHARGREHAEQQLIVLIELAKIPLHGLDVGLAERKPH